MYLPKKNMLLIIVLIIHKKNKLFNLMKKLSNQVLLNKKQSKRKIIPLINIYLKNHWLAL